MRVRDVIAGAVLGAVLAGAGVAIAQSQQSPSPSSSGTESTAGATSRDAFLDDVAERLSIQRSKLDAALQALALDKVAWAEANGLITKAEADQLRQRIRSGESGEPDHPGFPGHVGLGIGLPIGPGFHGPGGGHDRDSGLIPAAASYLGLSTTDLLDRLESRTLAQVAADQGKSVDGLKQALRAATKSDLDDAVTSGDLTQAQENALLSRFDSQADDLVNGIPPFLTDLAKQLAIDRAKVIAAVKGASIDQVDAALAQGRITKAQADAIKGRIQSGSGFPLFGLGPCGGGFGHFGGPGPGLGLGLGLGFDRTVIGA